MFAAGQIIVFEEGAYSSFTYAGPFRVLRDFTKTDAVTAYFAETNTPEDQGGESEFIAWLSRAGYLEDVGHSVWFLGDYRFEPLDWVNSGERTPEGQVKNDADVAAYNADRKVWIEAKPGFHNMTTGFSSPAVGSESLKK